MILDQYFHFLLVFRPSYLQTHTQKGTEQVRGPKVENFQAKPSSTFEKLSFSECCPVAAQSGNENRIVVESFYS